MNARISLAVPLVVAMIAVLPAVAAAADTVVGTRSELVAALGQAVRGDTVLLKPGEYVLEQLLSVPDGVTVDGGGKATLAGDGAPESLVIHGAATLRAADSLPDDLVSLGDGTQLRGLRIVQAPPPSAGRTRFGNTVVVRSRRPGDHVVATISNCDIHSNATYGAGPAGPNGRLILVETRSPDGEPPHETANLSLTIERSAINAPLGNAIFVNNFAAQGRIRVDIRRSLVTGFVSVSGGTTRGSLVTNASAAFHSEDTRYRRGDGGFDKFGWLLFGASGMPAAAFTSTVAGGVGNRSEVTSHRDRIEGFRIGVLGTGYRSVADFSAAGMDNRLELAMQGTLIQTSGDGAADLVLRGAGADAAPSRDVRIAPGVRNEVQLQLDGVRGSGTRANRYTDCDCLATDIGSSGGNRVVVSGTPAAFAGANSAIVPPPPETAFVDRDR